MPELPEVEYAARHLRGWLKGRTIVRAEAENTRVIRPQTPAVVEHALKGHKLVDLTRRAKYLLFTFDGGQGALGHLGMTGKWLRRPPSDPPSHSRLRLFLDDGSVVHYRDPRLFGQFTVHPAANLMKLPPIAALGPDPLHEGIDADDLGARLARTSRPVKVALLDQSVIAGIGNIYAAEALYRARLDPHKPGKRLKPAEVKALARGLREVIDDALALQPEDEITYVEEGGENPFRVYGRPGEKCRRCKHAIASFTQAGRTTWWCPGCQH